MADSAPVTVALAAERLGLAARTTSAPLAAPVRGAIVSDLLSYVMANGQRDGLWITIQTHPNIVAVAALAGLSAVVVAGGFEPAEDTIVRADEEEIALLTSPESAYALAGKLYEFGVR